MPSFGRDLYHAAVPVRRRLGHPVLTVDATGLTPEGVARVIAGAAPAPRTTVGGTVTQPQ